MRIAALEDAARLDRSRAEELRTEATELALAHGLLSAGTAFVVVEERHLPEAGHRAQARVLVPVHLPAGTRREAFEPTMSTPSGGMFHALAKPLSMARMAPTAQPHALAPRQGPGMAAKFLNALRRDLARDEAAGAAAPTAPAAPEPSQHTASPEERRDAALRFLARTQSVDGSWAGDEGATALAALAFTLAGHTERAGDFRPQLARTARWLAARRPAPASPAALALQALSGGPPDADAAREFVLMALRDAGHDPADLPDLQRLGGDADGAVLTEGASHLHPSATVCQLTAALAVVVD